LNTSWVEPIAAITPGRDFGPSITTFLDPKEYVIDPLKKKHVARNQHHTKLRVQE